MPTANSWVEGVRHRDVRVGEVRLHVAESGEGSPVLLLHGFPELWWSWRHQLPALARAGLHAIAPDMRGYNLSDQPAGVEAYALPRLVEDVAGLVRSLGDGKASVVGHDWGGVVAWAFAERHPELLDRLAILNAPHPARMGRALRNPAQLARSSYMLLFQLPWLPERLLRAGGYAPLRAALRAMRATPVSDAELEPYVAAARRSGGLRGGLSYYRALGRGLLRRGEGKSRGARAPSMTPVLVIWGMQDPVLGPDLAIPPSRFLDVRVERVPEASHDVQLDAPERVNALLTSFLVAPAPT